MKKLRLTSLVLTILLIFTACGADLSDFNLGINKKNRAENRVLYLIGYNFENSNPLLVKNEVNREIFSLIYDGLYTLDENYVPVPKLAKNMSVSADGLAITININTDARFHDGTKLSVNDVVSTISYLMSNSTYYTHNVSNFLSVAPKGNEAVLITLKAPAMNLAALLTFPIVNAKDLLSEFNFNGTGMFIVDNYIKRKYISLKVNDNYYHEKNEEIYKIEVQLMPDKETANYSYASGLSDIFSQDIFTDVSSLNPKTGSSVTEYESLNYSFLLLNHDIDFFSDVNVRKAINSSIDRERIVADVLFSHGEAVSTPIPKASALYAEDVKSEYKVNEAKNILTRAGYIPDVNTGILEKDDTKLSFSILVNNDNNFRIQVANLISDNLKYIGIDAHVEIVSFDEYKARYSDRTYEAFIGAVPMSADFDLRLFLGNNNVSGYESVKVKKILNDITLNFDYEKKKEHYIKLQSSFLEDIPHISLYYTKVNLQHSGKIKKGLKPTGYNIFNNIENWSFED